MSFQVNTHLNNIYKTLWQTRPDLQKMAGGNAELFKELIALRANKEYPALKGWISEDIKRNWDQEKEEYQDLGEWPRLNGLMYAIWASRKDLQDLFDLNSKEGRQGLADWLIFHGFKEMGLAPYLGSRFRAQLNQPVPSFHPAMAGRTNHDVPLTMLMLKVWERRDDIRQAFSLEDPHGYQGFMSWFFVAGLLELGMESVIDKGQAEWLLMPTATGSRVEKAPKEGEEAKYFPRILVWLAQHYGQLRQHLNAMDKTQAMAWVFSNEAWQAHPVLRRIAEVLDPESAPEEKGQRRASITPMAEKPFGINLIGYAKGQFGIGEDVRMAARACQAAGIPFSVYNIEPGKEVNQNDTSIVEHISTEQPYQINLLCTTGIETALMLAVEGPELFEGYYNIGYWPWELPEWPEVWHHAYELVDEVWASSRYAYNAFKLSSPVPVRHMPMAVTVDQTEGLARSDFSLPETSFLYVYGFDFLSYPTRKNPYAAIEAFKRAFPRGDEQAGLVIKVMRAQERPQEWSKLEHAIASDSRIYAVAETLSRGALLDLYRACDCFISLHRSEGFGRNIAEAMCLERPVIVTGYSGNMDFTTPATAALVNHEMVALNEGEYPFGDGQEWAEPDTDHAAMLMQRVMAEPQYAGRLARNGRQWVTSMCHPAVVGNEYAYMVERAIRPLLSQ